MDDKRPWMTVNDIVTIIGAVFSGLALLISTWNNTAISHVKQQQDVQVQKAEVISMELETAKKETAKKLDKIEATTNKVETKVMGMP